MRAMRHRLWIVLAAGVVVAGCGPKAGSTDSGRAQPRAGAREVGGPAPLAGPVTINGLNITERETNTVVRIEATGPIQSESYTVFKLTDPMRVVIDIQNSTKGEIGGPYSVANGTVNDVKATFFEDEGNKVSRIMIGLEKIVEYSVRSEGNAIVVEIPREGPMPAVTQMGTSGAAVAEAAAATPPPEAPIAEAAPVATPPVLAEAPAPIEPLPPESVPAPIEEPAPTPEPIAEPVAVAPPPDPVPEPTPEPAPIEPVVPEPVPAPTLAEVIPEPTPEPIVETASPDPIAPEPEPIAPAPEPIAEPVIEPIAEPVVEPVTPAPDPIELIPAPRTAPTSLVKMTALDFDNRNASTSRIIIKTAVPVEYEQLAPEGNTVVLELKGVRVPKSLERALDTSEFKSAVKLISTYQAGDNARVVVQLRENVPNKIVPQGNTYYFDFARPVGMNGTEVAAVSTDAAIAPPGVAPEPSAAPEAIAEPLTDPLVDSPATAPPAVVVGPSNGVRPPEATLADPAFAASASGKVESSGMRKNYTGRKISMDFKDADIHDVLRLIANVSKLNIITSDSVTGKVTMRLIQVPWDQALDIVLQSKKLEMAQEGNIVRIDTITNFTAERDEKAKARDSLSKLLPIDTLMLPVSYAGAGDMQARLSGFLSKEGKITVDDRTNMLLIQDHPEQLNRMRELAKLLDLQTPQVLIEARLVEARTAFSRTIGIQWGGAFNPNPTGLFFPNTFGVRGGNGPLSVGPRGATPEDNLAINLPGPSVSSLALFFGNLGQTFDLDARLGALETTDDIKVVSSPRIATLDNKAARISQGAKIPYLSASQQGTQTQFVDATLELSVTPHITADKSIFMVVSVKNNRPGSLSVGGQPSVDVAEAATEILVKDGDTTVIGGVYVVNQTKSRIGLPWLYKLPFIGPLFRTSTTSEDRRELLVFLTPRIITRSQAQAKNGN